MRQCKSATTPADSQACLQPPGSLSAVAALCRSLTHRFSVLFWIESLPIAPSVNMFTFLLLLRLKVFQNAPISPHSYLAFWPQKVKCNSILANMGYVAFLLSHQEQQIHLPPPSVYPAGSVELTRCLQILLDAVEMLVEIKWGKLADYQPTSSSVCFIPHLSSVLYPLYINVDHTQALF